MRKVILVETVKRLRLELDNRQLSLRALESKMGRSIRHKFTAGSEELFTYEDILDVLAVIGLEPKVFFARVFGIGSPIPFELIQPKSRPGWSQKRQDLLATLGDQIAAGDRGFKEARTKLAELEILRDEDPNRANTTAWSLLRNNPQPGAAVGLLAFLALGLNRAQGHALLTLATEIIGPFINTAAYGFLSMAIGRYYVKAGFPRDAIQVLKTEALATVALRGTQEDLARTFFHLAQAAGMVGDDELQEAAIARIGELGIERYVFHSSQLMAFQELKTGNLTTAAKKYDELIALPYFEQAGRRACAYISWSRLSAHFAIGQLGPKDEPTFELAVAEAKDILEESDQAAAVFDLVLFQESIGHINKAKQELEALLFTILELDDAEIQEKYIGLWKRLGLPDDARLATLVNRREHKDPQTHPKARFRAQD